jgi:Outer membrane protein beta-barrel domain
MNRFRTKPAMVHVAIAVALIGDSMGVAAGQNARSSDYRQSTRFTRTEVTRISPGTPAARNASRHYGKGGAAWANYKYDLTSQDIVLLQTFSGNKTRWGWMVGAGIEYAFFDNWSAKLEYNYMGFNTSTPQFTDTTGRFFLNTSIHQQLHVVKAGINYRWCWAPVGIRY